VKRFLFFLKHTRPFSRVLFFLWGASVYMGGASAVPFFSALLLLPAFLIEYARNPVFKKNAKRKNGNKERQRVSNERRGKETGHSLDGAEEKKEPIPGRTALRQRFFRDMEKYGNVEGTVAKPVPFYRHQPTYEALSDPQKNWYYYWRSQVRKGSFPDTPQAYIRLHAYELLSGFGKETPCEGYRRLSDLWMHYRKAYPDLDRDMLPWLFDFSCIHGLNFTVPDQAVTVSSGQFVLQNAIIHSHREDRPLKLPFALVEALCDYPVAESKFYREGRESLMKEAVPRVLALTDAALIQKTGKGILETYGPADFQGRTRIAFEGALCPRAGEKIRVKVRNYTNCQKLREFLTQRIRFSENVLRELYGAKGRLRGVCVDEETASLIREFLKREYTPKKQTPTPKEPRQAKLDFENIRRLRDESDAVRDVLAVDVSEEEGEEEISPVRTAPPKDPSGKCEDKTSLLFDPNVLPGELKAFLEALSPLQKKTLAILLKGETVTEDLSAVAERACTMAEILLDEINDLAAQTVGDLIIDTMGEEARVFAPYADQLIQAMKQEETVCQ